MSYQDGLGFELRTVLMASAVLIELTWDLDLVSSLTYFKHTTVYEVNVLLSKMNITTCLFDPFPTGFFIELFSFIY